MPDPNSDQAVLDLNKTLKSLKVGAEATSCKIKGPLFRFNLTLANSTKLSKLEDFSQELAMAMKASSEPLIMPSRTDGLLDGSVRLDLMVGHHPVVKFADLVQTTNFTDRAICSKYNIPILLGATDIDQPMMIDLQAMPHMLIAGVTGSGKSMMLHAAIKSIETHSASHGIRLCLIDPKLVEFGIYDGSKALRYSIANSVDQAIQILDDLHSTLIERLTILSKYKCRDILEYRALGKNMPFIVLVIDELADLMRATKSGFATKLCSLAEKSRAAGIHIIAATQHPSREVITGLLKAQFPARIGCKVATRIHSQVVLDEGGAEKLMGNGDALLLNISGDLQRFKGALVDLGKKPKPIKSKDPGYIGFLRALAEKMKSVN